MLHTGRNHDGIFAEKAAAGITGYETVDNRG